MSNSKMPSNDFKNDLDLMIRIKSGLDNAYAESRPDFDIYYKKFKTVIEDFNKKYKGLKLITIKRNTHIDLKIFLNEKSLKDCFESFASKIQGLQSIGTDNFGTAMVSDTAAFTEQLEKMKSKVYLVYYSPQTGRSSLFLSIDKKEKKVQVVYDESIIKEPSAEFQIVSYYALSKGYDNKISLDDTFGFSYTPGHNAKQRYYEKFDPHFNE
jgi:hypothetical protein